MMELLEKLNLEVVDAILLLILFVAWPLAGELGKESKKEGAPAIEPLDIYNTTIFLLWATALPILLWWYFTGRPWADLGLSLPSGRKGELAYLFVAGMLLYFSIQFVRANFSARVREKLSAKLSDMHDVALMMPRNAKEYRGAMAMALTAGITEEIIFRGYLIWGVSQFSSIWIAALVSILLFVFLHRYQGSKGMRQVALMTTVFTALYIVSGSLIPGIILHILVDVLNISRIAMVINRQEKVAS